MLTRSQEENLIDSFIFSSNVMTRGRSYYYSNNVPKYLKTNIKGGSYMYPYNKIMSLVKESDDTYTSEVLGSDLISTYEVKISADTHTCTCTCSHSFSGNNCKHAYATLLAIKNHDYDLSPDIEINIQKENSENNEDVKSNTSQIKTDNNVYGFDFNKVSEEAIIRGAVEADVPVFLHGKSSDGKSARVKQIDPDCIIIYLRNTTPEMLNGKSICSPSTEEIKDIKPSWLVKLEEKCAKEPDRIHIVFFDELSNALPSIQGMAFNIVLDKEVNGIWKLPENSRIVAAGNEVEDSLSANEISEPLFNRFAHVYIKTTLENWLDWAIDAKIHPAIYTYMVYTKGKHLRTEYNGETPNADPRKWEMASKMLYKTNSPEMLRSLLGKVVTDDFVRFCHQKVISVENILNKKYQDIDIKNMNIAEKYLTVVGLTTIDEDDYDEAKEFLQKLGKEFITLFNSLWARDNEDRLLLIRMSDKITSLTKKR